ncbi:hypothetical protein CUMW_120740, partial [Citrus unshiu]
MALYEHEDALMCRIFPSSLDSLPLNWYHDLPSSSIHEYCAFHNDCRHYTRDCRTLKKYIEELISKGQLKEFVKVEDKQPQNQNNFLKKDQIENSTSEPEQIVNTIMAPLPLEVHMTKERNSEVSFLPQDLKLIQSPHDDALVISIKIGNCLVRRILIDNGSSVNILDDATVEKMRLEQDKIKPFEQPLIGFSGISLLTDFLVVKATSPYNAILGRQWIHKMRVVPSTYHQVLCYQTIYGIEEIGGDQATTRTCAVLAL